MRRERKHSTAALAAGLAIACAPACAETVYVIDRLLVGVHSEESLESPIIKALPTGTPLEVLRRKGDLAQIKGPEGVTGWVDAVYLTKEQPAAMLLESLEAQNRELTEDLRTAQARIGELTAEDRAAAQPSESGKVAELAQQLDDARRQLEAEHTRAGELQSKLAAVPSTPPADAKALADLTQENAALKRELEEAQIKAIGAAETAQAPAQPAARANTSAGVSFLVGRWNISATAVIGVLFGALLVGLMAGIWLMDTRQRRRMGGFRI
ncbi:MAG: hypothetical protein NFCOHLIN_03033 [Gammaproteobacteria bacterium]|nr:hypothetical protein [Gammaproteobacteria bacterium]